MSSHLIISEIYAPVSQYKSTGNYEYQASITFARNFAGNFTRSLRSFGIGFSPSVDFIYYNICSNFYALNITDFRSTLEIFEWRISGCTNTSGRECRICIIRACLISGTGPFRKSSYLISGMGRNHLGKSRYLISGMGRNHLGKSRYLISN